MAGFYNVPFANVAKKPSSESLSVTKADPTESFMDIAKAIRHCTYAYMKVTPESCEVPPLGENKQLDKDMNTYLIHYKGMTRKNVSHSSVSLTLFSLFFVSFLLLLFYKNGKFSEDIKSKTRISPVGSPETKIRWPI